MKSPHRIRPELITEVSADLLALLQDIHAAAPIVHDVYGSAEHDVLFIWRSGQRLFIKLEVHDFRDAMAYLEAGEISIDELIACFVHGRQMVEA